LIDKFILAVICKKMMNVGVAEVRPCSVQISHENLGLAATAKFISWSNILSTLRSLVPDVKLEVS
jgi:hypothetical protein